MKVSDLQVGKQLFVGIGVPEPLGRSEEEIRGSAYIESPVILGKCDDWTDVEATLMVAREINTDREEHADRSLHVKGNTRLEGDTDTVDALTVSGGDVHTANFYGEEHENAVYIHGDLFVTGDVDCGNKGRLASRFATADSLGKIFDMVHPTKGNGYRLAYACIEGPEVGVYFRGRVKNSNEIKLPYYWKDLVHENSISVQLQPIGSHQDVIVKKWDDEKIYLQSNGGMPIDCFYHVYAERKDINPLHVEYKGDTHADYPDPNHRNFDPSDETRNLLDERYRGPRNTITKNKKVGEIARKHLTTDIADVEPVPVDETD